MSKIPKNLSDKEMFKNYKEEKTLENIFLEAEDKIEKHQLASKMNNNIKIAYLTQDIVDTLGKMLLGLKLDLYKEGIIDYSIKVEREGNKIILSPTSKKK